MKSLATLAFLMSATGYAQEIKLIGGKPANPADFPASVYASSSGGRCSATVVGERSVYIAAHCVSSGGSISFSVGANRYSATCTHSKYYKSNYSADYALCLTDKKVTGIEYEVVNTDPSILSVGKTVQLTGYGCTTPSRTGGNDGIYRVGDAQVTKLPTSSDNYIVTYGSAGLCSGDSGGPAFVYLDQAKTKRVLISINSRANMRDTSYLSSVATKTGNDFAIAWANLTNAKICGIHADAQGCRNANPAPALPQECATAKEDLKVYEQCLVATQQPSPEACQNAQSSLAACFEARQ